MTDEKLKACNYCGSDVHKRAPRVSGLVLCVESEACRERKYYKENVTVLMQQLSQAGERVTPLLDVIRAADALYLVLGDGAREDLAWHTYRAVRAKLGDL